MTLRKPGNPKNDSLKNSQIYMFYLDWALAPWVQRLIGANRECYAHEYSSVDPKSRLMEMKSINLTFCSFVNMKEQMSYFPHPEDNSKTLMRQETIVTVQGVPLTRYVPTYTNKYRL